MIFYKNIDLIISFHLIKSHKSPNALDIRTVSTDFYNASTICSTYGNLAGCPRRQFRLLLP